MAQNGGADQFYCESDSSYDSDDREDFGHSFRSDPLGVDSSSRRPRSPQRRRPATSPPISRDAAPLPVLDLTASPAVVRLKYRTARGTCEEGLYEVRLSQNATYIPEGAAREAPHFMLIPASQQTTADVPQMQSMTHEFQNRGGTSQRRTLPMSDTHYCPQPESSRNDARMNPLNLSHPLEETPRRQPYTSPRSQTSDVSPRQTETPDGTIVVSSLTGVDSRAMTPGTSGGSALTPDVAIQDPHEMVEVKDLVDGRGWRVAMRKYQLDLYRAASRQNVIAYLDTGSGKTFISVLLIRDIAARAIKRSAKDGGSKKAIFFLVPRKVLVYQQADVLKQFTDLIVSAHSGDRNNEDVWDKSMWQHYISKADVMVMTPQILLNMLRKQMIAIVDVSLLVFDECHHARKNNPYNCIMQEFYHPAKNMSLPTPKIFGMTASLVTKKRSLEEVCNSFLELEANMDSVIMTTSRENVAQHATSANEMHVPYSMNTSPLQLESTFHLLDKAGVRLTIANRLSVHHHKVASQSKSWKIDSKKQKGPLEQHIRQIGNIHHVISVLGPLAGCYAVIEVAENWMEKGGKRHRVWNFPSSLASNTDLRVFDERIKDHPDLIGESLGDLSEVLFRSTLDLATALVMGLMGLHAATARDQLKALMGSEAPSVAQVRQALRQVCSKLDITPVENVVTKTASSLDHFALPPDPNCAGLVSHRVEQLLRVLAMEKAKILDEERSEWRGMIFVQQTLMAIVLEHLLRINPQMAFFKCQSLTGHNGSIVSAAMEDHHQRKIVQMFRSGRVNLLISTSVAEEGLDITQCSMVIRFDLPFTEASYIQSRGRARKPGSSYIMFVNMDDPSEQTMIANLHFAEQCMKEFATHRQQQGNAEQDEDPISGTREAYLEISHAERTAVLSQHFDESVTGHQTAPEMIYRYVSQLPQDEYCQLAPHLIFRTRENHGAPEFQYQLTLPGNAALTKPVLGEWCSSKQKAKRSACYIACCELRTLGELNQRFYPISHKEFAEFKQKATKVNSALLSANTPIDPEVLKPTEVTRWDGTGTTRTVPVGVKSRGQMVLHLITATLVPAVDSIVERFGILTLKQIDPLMNFSLYPEQQDIEVELQQRGTVVVSDSELTELKSYHFAILEALYFRTKLFSSVCREKKAVLTEGITADVPFLTDRLKRHQDKIPNVNQTWYLMCPVKKVEPGNGEEADRHQLDKAEVDWIDDGSPSEEIAIDWEETKRIADSVARLHASGISESYLDVSSLQYGDILISPYNNAAYKLVGVRHDLNLNSAFPSLPKKEFYDPSKTKEYKGSFVPNRSGANYATFLEYYTQHWKFEGLDSEQPLLECVTFKQLSIVKKAKNLLNPTWKQAVETEAPEETLDDWNVAVHVLPQLLTLYPINYQFWPSLSYMVAISWKLESMVKVSELREQLFESIEPSLMPPDVILLYESVTSKSCHEQWTYERLEFIGDAVLKYVASLYCFFKFPLGHEGVLTTQRIAFISNRHLAQKAIATGLQNYIRSVQIGDHPWRPAGCQFLDACWIEIGKKAGDGHTWFGGRNQKVSKQNQMHQSRVCNLTVKQVADVVEALIGACFVSGDVGCACALMERLGILEEDAAWLMTLMKTRGNCGPWLEEVGECMEPGLDGFSQFDALRNRDFEHGRDVTVLEDVLNYRFTSQSFALEALTHCSWPHQDPPCYQRLEYLGDAVLDFMISTHYFKAYPSLDPGRLTALRSASVNNDRLAAAAVNVELYKFILHFSAYLQSHVSEYVSGFMDGENDKGAPKVLGDVVEALIGAVYLDLNGDIWKTWKIWNPLLEPLYDPETVPVHPVVQLANYCNTRGLKLEFVSTSDSKTQTALEQEDDDTDMDSSESDDEDFFGEGRCGKQALAQLDKPSASASKKRVQVSVDGKIVAEGEGAHIKGAKKNAALLALQSALWNVK